MEQWPYAVFMFYLIGLVACGFVVIPKAKGDLQYLIGTLVLLLIWPVIASDVIDMDRNDKGY